MTGLVFLGFGLLAWWAQRDAYEQGKKMGRLLEQRDMLTRYLVAEKKHLRVVK